jgi:hypothetical protein
MMDMMVEMEMELMMKNYNTKYNQNRRAVNDHFSLPYPILG